LNLLLKKMILNNLNNRASSGCYSAALHSGR
jgi:hypothetical protein